jgi:hypothetical protein
MQSHRDDCFPRQDHPHLRKYYNKPVLFSNIEPRSRFNRVLLVAAKQGAVAQLRTTSDAPAQQLSPLKERNCLSASVHV